MISWRVIGISGWDEQPPVAFQLRQRVDDLLDHEERQVEAAGMSCFVDISIGVHKAILDPNYITLITC